MVSHRYREHPRPINKFVADTESRVGKLERVSRFSLNTTGADATVYVRDTDGYAILADTVTYGGIIHPKHCVSWQTGTVTAASSSSTTQVTVATANFFLYAPFTRIHIDVTCASTDAGVLRLIDQNNSDNIIDTFNFVSTDVGTDVKLTGYTDKAWAASGISTISNYRDAIVNAVTGTYVRLKVTVARTSGTGAVTAKIRAWNTGESP